MAIPFQERGTRSIPWDGGGSPSSDALPRSRRDTSAIGVEMSEEENVRRTVLVLAAALVLASWVALAAVVNGTGDDRLIGTEGANQMPDSGVGDTFRDCEKTVG